MEKRLYNYSKSNILESMYVYCNIEIKNLFLLAVLARESVTLVSYLMLVYSAMKQLEKK
jgi:hypothetical protein